MEGSGSSRHLQGKPREIGGPKALRRRSGPSAGAAATPAGRGRGAARSVGTHAAAIGISTRVRGRACLLPQAAEAEAQPP